MDLDFSPVWAGWRDLAHGTVVTIEVTAGAIVLGCAIGLLIGLGRLDAKRPILYGVCTAYVAFVRGTPLLVQLFIWFFGLPYLGINLPAFFCGVVGMGMYSGAYVSEIVRGAIQSVARGQMEAARSLGMTERVAMRQVIVPQAAIRMIPPLGNEFIALIKDTALVSTIAMVELMRSADQLFNTYFNVTALVLATIVYLVLTTLFTLGFEKIEERAGVYEKR